MLVYVTEENMPARTKRNRTVNKKYSDFYLMQTSNFERDRSTNLSTDKSRDMSGIQLENKITEFVSPATVFPSSSQNICESLNESCVSVFSNTSLDLDIDLETLLNDSTVAKHMEMIEDMDSSLVCEPQTPDVDDTTVGSLAETSSGQDIVNQLCANVDAEQIHDATDSDETIDLDFSYATDDVENNASPGMSAAAAAAEDNVNCLDQNNDVDTVMPMMLENELIQNKRKIAKRGTADPTTWKRNSKALRRMKGDGRQMKDSKCKCCQNKLDSEKRQILFNEFWEVDWNRKRDFVMSNTEIVGTARKTTGDKESRRTNSIKYFLPHNHSRLRVCKEYFLSTLGIGTMFVRGALKHSSTSTFASPHGNTNRPPSNKTPNAMKDAVISFLRKLPTMPSHYCRKDSNLLYLEPGHTISKLYQMYQEESEKEMKQHVSEKIFRKIFSELNLSVFNPRKDQCDICVGFREGQICQEVYNCHIADKDQARYFKDLDKVRASESQGTISVATMDLQQVLLCPKSFSSAVYYRRKLCVHNFTVYDLVSKEGYCYLWHEGEGGLDSDEFASLVVEYLKTLPDSVQTAIFWSDGCTYQNRNSTLASAIMHFLRTAEKPFLTEVHQKYLTKGHTQMEVDSVHSAIETASSRIEISTPQEWATVMRMARVKNPYHVTILDHTFWKKYPAEISTIRPGKGPGDPVVTDIKHLVYTREGIYYSLSHGTPMYPLPSRPKRDNSRNMRDIQIKYSKSLPLTQPKIDDLKYLCQTIIPKEHHSFFETLF